MVATRNSLILSILDGVWTVPSFHVYTPAFRDVQAFHSGLICPQGPQIFRLVLVSPLAFHPVLGP